jgi:hypothetical protein
MSERPPRRNCAKAPRQPARDRLSEHIQAAFVNRIATRSAVELENILAACRRCERFTGNACREFGGCDGLDRYVMRLITRGRTCERWATSAGGDAPQSNADRLG